MNGKFHFEHGPQWLAKKESENQVNNINLLSMYEIEDAADFFVCSFRKKKFMEVWMSSEECGEKFNIHEVMRQSK